MLRGETVLGTASSTLAGTVVVLAAQWQGLQQCLQDLLQHLAGDAACVQAQFPELLQHLQGLSLY